MKWRLWAVKQLLKRYNTLEKIEISKDATVDALAVIISANTSMYQKKAARIILDYSLGVKAADDLINDCAVVKDRNDRLVRKWRKDVVERDGECILCGDLNGLQVHHISHWADDPINRVNVKNGITLCRECHAKEHPGLENLIRGGGSA